MNIAEQFEEYLDTLVTIEIAVAFAARERRPVNRTIRDCWRCIAPKLKDQRNIQIFRGLVKQPFPDGALKMLRRHLDEAAGSPSLENEVVAAINEEREAA